VTKQGCTKFHRLLACVDALFATKKLQPQTRSEADRAAFWSHVYRSSISRTLHKAKKNDLRVYRDSSCPSFCDPLLMRKGLDKIVGI